MHLRCLNVSVIGIFMLFTNPLDMHDGLASLTGWAQADPRIQPRMHASNQVDVESIQVPYLEEGRSIDTRGDQRHSFTAGRQVDI